MLPPSSTGLVVETMEEVWWQQNGSTGKVALVTGAGSGIGRADRGAARRPRARRCYGHDINAAALAETAALVHEAGGEMLTRAGDVSKHGGVLQAVVADCVDAYGQLDVLGNIAGHRSGRARHRRDRGRSTAR